MPEGRPYSLGNTLGGPGLDQRDIGNVRLRPLAFGGRVLENPRAVSYENDEQLRPSVRAVSAYAPVDPRGPSELLAGRGLY